MSLKLYSKLPTSAKNFWSDTYNTAKELYSEERSEKIAWSAVLNRLHKTEDTFVAKSSDFHSFSTVTYTFKAGEVISTKSVDGKTLVDFILTDSTKDKNGKSWGAMALKSFTDKINLEGVVGRIDPSHDLIKKLKMQGLTPDEIEEYLKGLNTGVRAIRATYDPKGKVTTTLEIDNDVFKEASRYGSLSIEARHPSVFDNAEVVPQANIMGFVLTNNPVNPNAIRV